MDKIALLFGGSGQVGHYLQELLRDNSYKVYIVSRGNNSNFCCDYSKQSIDSIISCVNPEEIYFLAAQTDAVISVSEPEETLLTNGNLVMTLCAILRERQYRGKLFVANSVQIYRGLNSSVPIDGDCVQFYPKNPYGIAKLSAFWTVKWYREYYGLKLCSGMLTNTESPYRTGERVTTKVIQGFKQLQADEKFCLTIGSLDSECDWIHAADVANAAYMMMQAKELLDCVIATTYNLSVRRLIEIISKLTQFTLVWSGSDLNEIGIDANSKRILVKVDAELYRPFDKNVQLPQLSNERLRSLGWSPRYSQTNILEEMYES